MTCGKALVAAFVLTVAWQASPTQGVGLPPDPNNAALLYYQAFLACPEPPERERARLIRPRFGLERVYGHPPQQECALDQVESGAAPDDLVRDYVEMCGNAIELTERAIRLSDCSWGTLYSQGFSYRLRHLPPMRLLSRVLCAHARIVADDGAWRAALQQCLSAHTLVKHVGDHTGTSFLTGMDIDKRIHVCIRQILGSTPPDIETITWLKAEITALRTPPGAAEKPLEGGFRLLLKSLYDSDKTLSRIRSGLATDVVEKPDQDLSDADLLARVEESYRGALKSLVDIMARDMAYQKAWSQMQDVLRDLEAQVKQDLVAQHVARDIMTMAEDSLTLYSAHVSSLARFNALQVALELYLMSAQTGTLPDELPSDLPKDPFSHAPFDYVKTDRGFVLRPNVDTVHAHRIEQFEFVGGVQGQPLR
ncbi:MAG: hypothetical protein QM570_01315 [Planctomycetota bacterium]|nr:hypothetical protein [Planctomycetota bacterium]